MEKNKELTDYFFCENVSYIVLFLSLKRTLPLFDNPVFASMPPAYFQNIKLCLSKNHTATQKCVVYGHVQLSDASTNIKGAL